MKKLFKIFGVGAGFLVVLGIGFLAMKHMPATLKANAQSGGYPNPGIVTDGHGGANPAATYDLSLPSQGPYTNDFQLWLRLFNNNNSYVLSFLSPLSTQSMNGRADGSWTVSNGVLGGPTYHNVGNWSVWGFPGISSGLVTEGGGSSFISVIKGASLPPGEIIDNLNIGLQIDDDNGGELQGTTRYDYNASECRSMEYDPSAALNSGGAGYTGTYGDSGVIWSLGAKNCDSGFSPDIARMYMSDDVFNSASSSDNIPATFNENEKKTTGTDGSPLEITVKNTGNSPWVSTGATIVPGSEAGSCAGIVNGFDCPASGNYGATCTALIDNSSDVQLKHLPGGSFGVGSDPAQSSQIAKETCTVLSAGAQTCSFYANTAGSSCTADQNTCTATTGGTCSASGSESSMCGSSCLCGSSQQLCEQCDGGSGRWTPPCDGQWTSYSTSVVSGYDPNIEPGQTGKFILNSLTAPGAAKTYTDNWQTIDNRSNPFGAVIPITINVVNPNASPTILMGCNPTTIYTNGTSTCSATVLGASEPGVSWTSSPSTISDNGNETALYTAGGSPGTVTVKACSTAPNDSNICAVATITVIAAPTISVSCNPTTIYTNGTSTCSATVKNINSTTVKWTASTGPATIADNGNDTALYTADGSPGTTTVTACSTVDPAVCDSATITVANTPTISASCTPSTILVNGTSTCASGGAGIIPTTVTWTSTSKTIVSTGDRTALYTAGNSPGTVTVTACYTAAPSICASAMITVLSTGSLTVTSENSQDASILVPASWDLSGPVSGGFVCLGVDGSTSWNGTPCSGTTQTYTGVPASNSNYILVDDATTVTPNYSFKAIAAPSSQTLSQSSLNASFVIQWDPDAVMNLAPGAVSFASPTSSAQTITVTNAGAPDSQLVWTATAATTSGGNWLNVSQGSTVTNGKSGSASANATVSLNSAVANALVNGTYNGTITFTGTDPISGLSIKNQTVPVVLTVPTIATPGISVKCAAATITMTQTSNCTATVTNISPTTVTWSANIPSIAGSGLDTATYTPTAPGNVTVTACSTVDPTVCASAPITVKPGPQPGITGSCNPTSIYTNGTSTCTAKVTNVSPTTVTWTASTGANTIKDIGNGTALYTATNSPGTVVVTACSTVDPNLCVPISLTVNDITTPVIHVACSPTSIPQKGTSQCSAVLLNIGAPGVTWTASTGTISIAGVYTAPNSSETVVVTGCSQEYPNVCDSANITVGPGSNTPSVTVDCEPSSIPTTGTSNCTATVTNLSATTVSWTASTGASTISDNGNDTATYTPDAPGTVSVFACSTVNSAVCGSARIQVIAVQPPTITVTCASTSITMAQTSNCTATVTNLSPTSVNWSASIPTIAGTGPDTATYTPTIPGTAVVVYACSTANSGICGFAIINVSPVTPPQVTVKCVASTIFVDGTSNCTATVTNLSPTTVTWTASTGANTISDNGNDTATYTATNSPGSVTVTACSTVSGDTNVCGTANITVNDFKNPSVSVSCNPASIFTNGTSTCAATVANINPASVDWSVSTGSGTIKGIGLDLGFYTAGDTAGAVTIEACSTVSSSVCNFATITVKNGNGEFSCVNNACKAVSSGGVSLPDCQAACDQQPQYGCVQGACAEVASGGTTLPACEAGGCAAPKTFSCVNNACQSAVGGVPYATCEAACDNGGGGSSGYTCSNNSCVYDPSSGVPYATCEAACDNGGGGGGGNTLYTCSSNKCEIATSGGVSLPDCNAACGPICQPGDPSCSVSCTLTPTPGSIVIPESSNLVYSCAGATSCTLQGGSQYPSPTNEPTTGSITVTPSSTTTYTLNCTNPSGGIGSYPATVTVSNSTLCEQNPNAAGCPTQ